MKTLVIGRSPYADVVIADLSVSPHHAELVVTDDGRLHLTDGGGAGGCWRQQSQAAGWTRIRQAFVRPDESLRLGDYPCRAGDLLRRAGLEAGAAGEITAAQAQRAPARLRGRLERDPMTGEIVRRRP